MAGSHAKEPTEVDRARRMFSNAGLSLPPIPERFSNALRMTTNWCFSTCAINPDVMYMFDQYLWEALAGQSPDYLAFSHAGHGLNSYALNYQLVDGPLVLIVQAPFGGVYMTNAHTEGAIAQFQRCEALIEAVEGAKARGLNAQSGRLYVFESELRGLFAWGWLKRPLDDAADARSWFDRQRVGDADERPTIAAREWLHRSFVEPER